MATNPQLRGDLLQEWDAQIAKIVNACITLTHIDGHGHCHAHPSVAGVVLQLARKYRIANVRLPAEPIWWKPGLNASPRFLEKTVLNMATQVPRQVWKGSLNFPDAFYGFSQGGRMSAEIVRDVGKSAPHGVSELMVHVGVSNDEAPGFWTGYDYAGDLQAVTTYSKQQFEAEFGVSLVTHVKEDQMDSGEQRKFWDQHITEWATSAYEKDKKLPFVEEMAKPWRKHLKLREDMAVDIVREWAPESVVELGCGMGEFAAAFLKASSTVRRYRAFDIAEPAVAKTRERVAAAAASNLDVDVREDAGRLNPEEFRDCDVLVGLGILP
jgi:hypothetical protein